MMKHIQSSQQLGRKIEKREKISLFSFCEKVKKILHSILKYVILLSERVVKNGI